MAGLACVLLTLAIGGYVFWPERKAAEQREKTRLEYLEEQRAALYDSLRDLRFERAAGKYSDEEFERERSLLEGEAIAVVNEIELLAASGSPVRPA